MWTESPSTLTCAWSATSAPSTLIAAVDKGGPDAVQNIMRLFDRLFGEQQDRIIDALSDDDGFCSAQRFTEFCVHLLSEVGAKN